MAIIKKSEIKGMEKKQLQSKKAELQKELIKINAQLSTKTTPENPGRIKAIKKTIARINTIIYQNKIEQPKAVDDKKAREVKKQK